MQTYRSMTHQRRIFFGLTLLLLFVFASCSKEDALEQHYATGGQEYYPLRVGTQIIYDVIYYYYDDFGKKTDTSEYQIKEVVESALVNEAGDTIYRIERYRRDSINQKWSIVDVCQASIDYLGAYKTVDNLRYLKLAFPVGKETHWQQALFIDSLTFYQSHYELSGIVDYQMKTRKSAYSEVGEPMEINGHYFPETVSVLHHDYSTMISRDLEQEIYAKNVGLIYRHHAVWRKVNNQLKGYEEVYSYAGN